MSALPTTVSGKYACVGDLAIMQADGHWQAVARVPSKVMPTVCKLKLRTTNTVSTVFHLKKRGAKRDKKVNFNNETLPFYSEPKTSE